MSPEATPESADPDERERHLCPAERGLAPGAEAGTVDSLFAGGALPLPPRVGLQGDVSRDDRFVAISQRDDEGKIGLAGVV